MEEQPTFEGRSSFSLEHALHEAAEHAAHHGLKGKTLRVVSQEVVLSNPHINEFRVIVSPTE